MKSIALLMCLVFTSIASAGPPVKRDFRSIIGVCLAFESQVSITPVTPIPVPPSPSPVSNTCPNCKGRGYVGDGTVKVTCPVCNGTGKLTRQDKEEEISASNCKCKEVGQCGDSKCVGNCPECGELGGLESGEFIIVTERGPNGTMLFRRIRQNRMMRSGGMGSGYGGGMMSSGYGGGMMGSGYSGGMIQMRFGGSHTMGGTTIIRPPMMMGAPMMMRSRASGGCSS